MVTQTLHRMKKIIDVILACFVYSLIAKAQESKFVGTWAKTFVGNYYNADNNSYVVTKSKYVMRIDKYGTHFRIQAKYVPIDGRREIEYLPEYTVTNYTDTTINFFGWHYKLGFSDGLYKDIKTYYHLELLEDEVIKLCGDSIDHRVFDHRGNFLYEEKSQKCYGSDDILYKDDGNDFVK